VSGTFLGSIGSSITNRRVSIPQSFRELIALSARMLVVAVRGRSNTIYIFPMDVWKKLEADLEQGSQKEKQLLENVPYLRYCTTKSKDRDASCYQKNYWRWLR